MTTTNHILMLYYKYMYIIKTVETIKCLSLFKIIFIEYLASHAIKMHDLKSMYTHVKCMNYNEITKLLNPSNLVYVSVYYLLLIFTSSKF